MTTSEAPLLASREALAEVIAGVFWKPGPGNQPCNVTPAWADLLRRHGLEVADAILDSGAVRNVATLADDEALVERYARAAGYTPDRARAHLRALAAALSEPRP